MDWREIIESYKIMMDKEKAKSDWLLLASSRANTKGGQIKSAWGMSSTWKKKKNKKNFDIHCHRNLWMPTASTIQKADLSTAL